MAKSKPAAKTAAAETVAPTSDNPAGEAPTSDNPTGEAAASPIPRTRGPKGVGEGAKITLLVQANPKRPGSKAEAVFSCYKDGMTVGEFCDAVDALGPQHKGAGTPNLVYDSKHGFISIEGYTVPGGVLTPKPKAPPKPKAEKKAKAPTSDDPAGEAPQTSAEDRSAAARAVEEAAGEETV